MWHIILLFLKILGIVFLVILGIVLVLVCAVLFVPVRYRIDAKKRLDDPISENPEVFSVQIYCTWLLHMLTVPISFQDKKFSAKVKIFGITVKDLLEKSETDIPGDEPENTKQKSASCVTQEEMSASTDHKIEESGASNKETSKLDIKAEGHPFFLKRILLVILEKIKKLKQTIRHIYDTLKQTLQKGQQIKTFLWSDDAKEALISCKNELIRIVKKLLPRNTRGWIRFGLDDPADTGQLLGVISIILGKLPPRLRLYPDFESLVLELELHSRGHMHLVTLAGVIWRVWRDQTIQSAYQTIKNGFLVKEEIV